MCNTIHLYLSLYTNLWKNIIITIYIIICLCALSNSVVREKLVGRGTADCQLQRLPLCLCCMETLNIYKIAPWLFMCRNLQRRS